MPEQRPRDEDIERAGDFAVRMAMRDATCQMGAFDEGDVVCRRVDERNGQDAHQAAVALVAVAGAARLEGSRAGADA
jgi:hypothetical protein